MAKSERIKVMVVGRPQKSCGDGLREVLERSCGFEVVGEAGDGEAAVKIAKELSPEVIIMDVMMPVKNGVDASREITEALPETRVLILTASTQSDAVMEALAAGATGYLQKHSGKETLLRAIRDVADGEYRIPADVMRRVFVGTRAAARPGEAPGAKESHLERTGDSQAVFAWDVVPADRRCQGQ